MLLTYQKIPVTISKFFKLVISKTRHREAYFKSIKSDVVNRHIIYRLYDNNEMIVFYKKANLNVYRRAENAQNNIKLEILKSDIIPEHVARAYANENHDFIVYLSNEFMLIVYSEDSSKEEDDLTWNVLIYDMKHKIWSNYNIDIDKFFGGIYSIYYLKKCRRVVLLNCKPIFSDDTFRSAHDTRRGFKLYKLYFIFLPELKNNEYKYHYVNFDQVVEMYVKSKYAGKYNIDSIIDYSIDPNNSTIYMICRIRLYDSRIKRHTISISVLEYNLCGEIKFGDVWGVDLNEFKDFEIELPVPMIEEEDDYDDDDNDDEIEDKSRRENRLLYLSDKRRKKRGIPKYLPMHISSEFYDFMSNKLFHSEMIFSSHSKPLVRDRYFNRIATVLAKIESLKVASHIPLQEDIITMRNGRNNKLLAVLIMNDVAIVKSEK